MKRTLLAAAGTIALAASAAPPAGAATATFGADLNNLPANNDSGAVCSAGIPGYGLAGSNSCMFTYFGINGADTLFTPASGTVTAIRVKVGNVTGKMRVNVVRLNYQQTADPGHPKSVSGPYLEAYGPEFTPRANAITQIATSLPVQLDPNPAPWDVGRIQSSDALALEVEAPNVPIPLDSDAAAQDLYATYPGPTEQGLQAPSYNSIPNTRQIDGQNLGVLMSADLTTGPGPESMPPRPVQGPPPVQGPFPAQGPTPAPRPAIKFLGGPVRVKHGTATIPLRCLVVDCSGRVSLQNATAGARARSAGTKRYGSASFRGRAGRTARVKIRLNAAGRALLRRHRKATVLAKVSFTAGHGAAKSFRLTLKR